MELVFRHRWTRTDIYEQIWASKYISYIAIQTDLQIIVGNIAISKVTISTKVSRWWKAGTKGAGVKGWWLTAGILNEAQMATIIPRILEKGSSLHKYRTHLYCHVVHLLIILFSYFQFFLSSPSIRSNFHAK